MLRGIDISGHQHDASFEGISFAFLKATQSNWEDVTFNGTGTWDGKRYFLLRKAFDAGTIPGAFHFLIDNKNAPSPEVQAVTFVNAIRRANGNADGILCAVFVEHSLKYRSVPSGKAVRAFIEEFQRQLPNRALFIYTNTGFWQSHVKLDLRNFRHVYLWLAWWTDASGDISRLRPLLPKDAWTRRIGGLTPTIIQFTSQARSGDARVRGNLYRDDLHSLWRLTYPELPTIPQATHAFKAPPKPFPKPRPNPKTKTKLVTGSVIVGAIAIMLAAGMVAYLMGKERWQTIFDRWDEE